MDGKADYSKLVMCVCQKAAWDAEREERMRRLCRLPKDTEHMTLDSYVVRDDWGKRAKEAALNIANGATDPNFGGWLTFMGWVDQGKTHLAIAVARAWLDAGSAARYIHVPLLLDHLKADIGRNDQSFERDWQFFLNVPLLILDDLGTEKRTEWAEERLGTIIDHRCMEAKPLIITTNEPLTELPPRWNSRIQRKEDSVIIEMEGEEYRLYKQRRQGEVRI